MAEFYIFSSSLRSCGTPLPKQLFVYFSSSKGEGIVDICLPSRTLPLFTLIDNTTQVKVKPLFAPSKRPPIIIIGNLFLAVGLERRRYLKHKKFPIMSKFASQNRHLSLIRSAFTTMYPPSPTNGLVNRPPHWWVVGRDLFTSDGHFSMRHK
jgi:hypothetical protein